MLRALEKHPKELGNKGLRPSVPWRSEQKVCESHGKVGPALTLACWAFFFFLMLHCVVNPGVFKPLKTNHLRHIDLRHGSEGAGWVSGKD